MEADDYAQIHNLLFQYALSLDTGDVEAMAGMFAEAEVHFGETHIVRNDAAAVLAAYRVTRLYPDSGTPKTHHVTSNVMVVPEGPGTASSRSYFTVFQAVADTLPLQPVIAGRYQDRFVKADGAWRFAERRIEMTLLGNLSAHLTEIPGP
jgi:3-phenylpropionate/cinnamic acid dioxygenase small subunit